MVYSWLQMRTRLNTNPPARGNAAGLHFPIGRLAPLLAIGAIATVHLSSTGCQRVHASTLPSAAPAGDESIAVPADSPLRAKLVVAAADTRDVRPKLLVAASVEADPARLAKITPPLTGRVKNLFVRQGEIVKKGQPLFELDAPDLVAARADFLRARSVLLQAEQVLRRQKDLLEHSIAAQRDVEEAQTAFDVARDDLDRAGVRLRLLGIDSGGLDAPLTVRSPLAGQVLSLATAPGEFRNDSTTPLLVVADLTSLWVTASVPERDVDRVRPGDEARIQVAAFGDRTFSGRVLFIESVLDTDTRTAKVRIQLENHDLRLKPGMFATVAFVGAPVPSLVVPTTALFVSQAASYVWVEKSPWSFVRREVELGAQERESAIVIKGLASGERIVVKNGALLQ